MNRGGVGGSGQPGNLLLYNQAMPANGALILDPANFFFLISSGTIVTANIQHGGTTEQLVGLSAGIQIKRVASWKQLILTAPAGTQVQFFYGYNFTRDDQTNFQSTIATLSGTVNTSSVGASGIQDNTNAIVQLPGAGGPALRTNAGYVVPQSPNAGVAGLRFLQNLARRRITLQNLPGAAQPFWVSFVAGSGSPTPSNLGDSSNGLQIPAGTQLVLNTTSAFDVVQFGAASQNLTYIEEF